MSIIHIMPGNLSGEIDIPSSKSLCHRAIISAGLSKGDSVIRNVSFSKDIEATCRAMSSLGVNIIRKGNTVKVSGNGTIRLKNNKIDCIESGSTLRFLIPIACCIQKEVTFKGRGKLVERPLDDYYNIFDEKGIFYKNTDGKLPLTINGKLTPGKYCLKGDVSSQFITGMLFALPLLNGDSVIKVTTPLESKGYVDMTTDVLERFGVHIDNHDYREFLIKGNQQYKAQEYSVEGDFSQAAFWIAAGLLGGSVWCRGMNEKSLQGDKAILKITEDIGGKIIWDGFKVKSCGSSLNNIIVDARDCPDLVPIVAVIGALNDGKVMKIVNAERLRYKESDRLKAISLELNAMGADVKETKDGLIINGVKTLKGGKVKSWNDHRIAMALAIASMRCKDDVFIEGAESVEKSYPDFWNHFRMLGGKAYERNMGK